MVVLSVYTYVASFLPKLQQENAQKWMGSSGPPPTPYVQTGVKSGLST